MVQGSPPHTCSQTADHSQKQRDNLSHAEVEPLAHQPMASHHGGIKLVTPQLGEPTHELSNPLIQQQKVKPLATLRGQLKSKGMSVAQPLPPAVPVSTPGAGPSTEQLQHTKSGSSHTSREEGSTFPEPFNHIAHDWYPPTIEVTIPHRLFSSNDDESMNKIIRPCYNDKEKARDDHTQSSLSLDVIHQTAGKHLLTTLSQTPIKHKEASTALHKMMADEVQSKLGSI
jgi:hypothetical protein